MDATIEPCVGQLDPAYAARLPLIEGIHRYGPTPLTDDERARIAAFDAPYGPDTIAPCTITDAVAPGPHGPIPVRIYGPDGDFREEPSPALVWLHGGAFRGGDLDLPEADQTARYVATVAGCPVVSVDYRLANDGVHHPIPEDDVVAAYRWVRDGGTGLPIDPQRVALGGGSAGGALAASASLRLRDEGAAPWQAFLLYPVLHWTLPEPSNELADALAQLPENLRMSPAMSEAINSNYVGGPREAARPYAFAGDGHDLTGFPPTLIENCEFDALRSSGERFAAQLRDAGVDVDLVTAAGVPHAHLNWVGSPRAHASCQRMCDRITGGTRHD